MTSTEIYDRSSFRSAGQAEKQGTVRRKEELYYKTQKKNELSPNISSEKDFKLKIRFVMSHRTQKFYLDVIHRHKT